MITDYGTRYNAINDALWLMQRGPRDPNPPNPDPTTDMGVTNAYGYLGGPSHMDDPRLAEIAMALDIARFLMGEENPEPMSS